MSMGSTGNQATAAQINVTPLIDVLLVLLIIFMVIVPSVPKGLEALAPLPPNHSIDVPTPRAIVVQVIAGAGGDPTYRINEEPVVKSALESRLQQIFAARQERVMFVRGDPGLLYASIAEVIDFGHQAGVDNVGIMTAAAEAGR